MYCVSGGSVAVSLANLCIYLIIDLAIDPDLEPDIDLASPRGLFRQLLSFLSPWGYDLFPELALIDTLMFDLNRERERRDERKLEGREKRRRKKENRKGEEKEREGGDERESEERR